ncbi:MAG: hypothetical protein M1837_006046 [Sclerophora amabilis]|nr:MAG: hypothetical protein M1837_006046 [Sclerophora amabilis]
MSSAQTHNAAQAAVIEEAMINDLGQKRRDNLPLQGKKQHVDLAALEQNRRARQRGSAEARLTSGKEELTSRWKTDLVDPEDEDEHLETDMGFGQSHRKRMVAEMQSQPPLSNVGRGLGRPTQITGRGGGVVGTSGRAGSSHAPSRGSTLPSREAISQMVVPTQAPIAAQRGRTGRGAATPLLTPSHPAEALVGGPSKLARGHPTQRGRPTSLTLSKSDVQVPLGPKASNRRPGISPSPSRSPSHNRRSFDPRALASPTDFMSRAGDLFASRHADVSAPKPETPPSLDNSSAAIPNSQVSAPVPTDKTSIGASQHAPEKEPISEREPQTAGSELPTESEAEATVQHEILSPGSHISTGPQMGNLLSIEEEHDPAAAATTSENLADMMSLLDISDRDDDLLGLNSNRPPLESPAVASEPSNFWLDKMSSLNWSDHASEGKAETDRVVDRSVSARVSYFDSLRRDTAAAAGNQKKAQEIYQAKGAFTSVTSTSGDLTASAENEKPSNTKTAERDSTTGRRTEPSPTRGKPSPVLFSGIGLSESRHATNSSFLTGSDRSTRHRRPNMGTSNSSTQSEQNEPPSSPDTARRHQYNVAGPSSSSAHDNKTSNAFAETLSKSKWADTESTKTQEPKTSNIFAGTLGKSKWADPEPSKTQEPKTRTASPAPGILGKSQWADAESSKTQEPKMSKVFAGTLSKSKWAD